MNKTTYAIIALTIALIGSTLLWNQSQEALAATSDQLPDFSFSTLDDETWKSSEHLDKVLVINFWATWCPPCRKEMPLFVDLQAEFAERDVLFIGIAIDNKDHVQDFVDTYGIEFPILLGDMQGSELAKQLGSRFGGLPYTVIVKKGGLIHKRHSGGLTDEQLRPVLIELTSK